MTGFAIRFAAAALLVASPAWAQSVPAVPGIADIGLLAVGIAGLVVGRRGSRSRRD